MELSDIDRALIAEIQHGLPLSVQPYADVGTRVGLTEQEVIDRIAALMQRGVIKRMGVIVRHHELGYRANAMVVWDVPNNRVAEVGARMSRFEFVTLCYRRPRRPPDWNYNLFCMIHGRDRETVLHHVARLVDECGLRDVPHEVLFSRRRFKQRGALYLSSIAQLPPAAWAARAIAN